MMELDGLDPDTSVDIQNQSLHWVPFLGLAVLPVWIATLTADCSMQLQCSTCTNAAFFYDK